MPVNRLNKLTNFTPTSLVDHNPTAVTHPPNSDILDKIDVKKLLDVLQILNEEKSAQVSEATSLPSSTVVNVVRDFDYSKECKIDEDSSKNQVTEQMIFNTAYDKVLEHIRLVNETIQKNYELLMKLNILKGMLMMEEISVHSKESTPWIKYFSKYKNIANNY
ncbi:PREDICTED: uncharacterized protein LOC107161448 [Diuraphis noxia]|uniref:uncharacterized protein LOC107161448 n=1 Tax=Diuraphis noxia TaxID=143948 RepID=UPI0007638675|nr:PREDICTED: uncharacterized protein LOC107161448 [Diuraphis noxia]